MNNPKFYIYGVPHGFNMLSGTRNDNEILYYQLFYDTSKKGREMRINRKANGETVYSYLIYNLVACNGREGAFLGMSIAFSGNEYCNNPVALKELFEGVYNEVILKADDKDKIIAAIEGGNAVGRFCITKFEERREMCERIGRIIINNIVGELTNSIRTIDTSFDNSREGRILTLPINADNASIIKALRGYIWVSLSTECKVIPTTQSSRSQQGQTRLNSTPLVSGQDLLSVHFTTELANKVSSYKDFIIQGLKGLVSTHEISSKREEINRYLDTLEEYAGRQPELTKLKDDYISIYKEIVGLNPKRYPDNQSQGQQTFNQSNNHEIADWQKLLISHLSKIIFGAAAVLVVVFVIVFWPSPESDKSMAAADSYGEKIWEEHDSGTNAGNAFDENKFNSLLDEADFKTAWTMLQTEEDLEKRRSLARALQNSYSQWFNNELEIRHQDLQGLLELKEIIASYVDFNEDNTLHNNLLDEYIKPLQEQAARKENERLAQQQREQQERLAREREQQKSAGEESGAAGSGGRSRGNIIKIFKADGEYRKGEQVSASGNVIKCKRNDCFVVEGATLSSKDKEIEADLKDGVIRIRVPKVGLFKVKLNQVEYTFQATSS